MGYEYKFEIHTTDSLLTLSKTIKSGFRWHPKEVWAYLSPNWMECSGIQDMPYNDIVDSFKVLKTDGFTGITVEMSYFVNSPFDNVVNTLYHCDASINPAGIFTLSNDYLEKMLKAISEAGLEAHVMPHFYINQKYQDNHGWTYQAMIDPTNPAIFFSNYFKTLQQIIPFLNKYNVKLLTVFDEADLLELKHSNLIKDLLLKISTEFNGEIGVNETTNNLLIPQGAGFEGRNGRTFEQVEKKISFWDFKDYHGKPLRIEFSCWILPIETQSDQRVTVMEKNFSFFGNLLLTIIV